MLHLERLRGPVGRNWPDRHPWLSDRAHAGGNPQLHDDGRLDVILIAADQRGELARPYADSLAKTRDLMRTIKDGKSAFEAGKALGKRSRRSPSGLCACS